MEDSSLRRIALVTLVLLLTMVMYAGKQQADVTPLAQWQAGTTVSDAAVKAWGGLDKCFAAEPVPDAVWQRMQGKTYKPNPHIRRSDLRHVRVLHWDYDEQTHIGEMICHKRISDVVVRIFRQLYDARYPIQSMVLPEVFDTESPDVGDGTLGMDERQMRHNNTSCFFYRPIAGSKQLSKHSKGLAIDINPRYNPYYRQRADGTNYIQPATSAAYCDRTRPFPYKIVRHDLCYRLFTEAGFVWGGSWTSCKDYQHFEWKE